MHSDDWQCFLLHSRPYQDNSLLVEFFSREQGRIGAVARNVYAKKNNTKALLQLFLNLKVQCFGKGDLLTLRQVEIVGAPIALSHQAKICGFYLNELLMYSLQRHQPHTVLFDCYHQCLLKLAYGTHVGAVLRVFELCLLTELGYGIDFEREANTHQPICANKSYAFLPLSGFRVEQVSSKNAAYFFQGEHLQAISRLDFSEAAVVEAAKRLTRLALQPLLNGREIHSRQLLTPIKR